MHVQHVCELGLGGRLWLFQLKAVQLKEVNQRLSYFSAGLLDVRAHSLWHEAGRKAWKLPRGSIGVRQGGQVGGDDLDGGHGNQLGVVAI